MIYNPLIFSVVYQPYFLYKEVSTTSLFRTHTEPLNPSTPHVTQMTRRRAEKNGRVCLCQGLMRRVMPWIGCSVGSPQFPLVQSGPVMCDWRDITQPRLTGPRRPCQHALQPPSNHAGMHCINEQTLFISLHFSVVFFFKSSFPGQHTLIRFFFFSIAGAHIQANEKWQLCTLFAIQHLPRPPVSQKEGELHSLTPMSPLLFTKLCRSYCLYDLKTTPGSCLLHIAIMGRR